MDRSACVLAAFNAVVVAPLRRSDRSGAAKEEWHQWSHEGPVWFPKHVGNYILSKSLELLVPSFYMTQTAQREVARPLHGRLAMLC